MFKSKTVLTDKSPAGKSIENYHLQNQAPSQVFYI